MEFHLLADINRRLEYKVKYGLQNISIQMEGANIHLKDGNKE